MTEPRAPRERRGILEQLLTPFTVLRPGEGANAALLMLGVFLLLTAYYVLKVVREPLILSSAGGAELKSYASAAQAVLLLGLIPAYGWVANRVNRTRLIGTVTLFFIANLFVFYAMALAGVSWLGVAFFVWVGIFSLMIVAQFWSFANDVYTPEQGRRLFAILGFGQTTGAVGGGFISKLLIGRLHVYQMMLVAAAMLAAYLLLILIVHYRMRRVSREPAAAEQMADRRGGFALVLRSRYLLLIALLLWVLNFVNTNGEYILGRVVTGAASQLAASGQYAGSRADEFVKTYIGSFYADYFTWVNTVTAVIQLFLVSRILRYFGVRAALYMLPVVALGAYGLVAFLPVLALIRAAKIGENSLDYSLNNTARHALFLPTSREEKYKAKAAIDTLFHRAGDLSSAGLVFIGSQLALQTRDFAIINMVLVGLWLVIVSGIGRQHRRLTEVPSGHTAIAN